MDSYVVTFEYGNDLKYESTSLTDATRMACACAMHTGKRFVVRRRLNSNGVTKDITLFGVSPSAFDFRSVSPEAALALKAMAHELVSNIDDVVPPIPNEGPER